MRHRYLFILTAPFSGSTLLASLLDSSPQVSVLKTPQHEGLKLPGMHALLIPKAGSEYNPLPWGYLRELYHRHWDLSKPVLVEKGQYPKHGENIQRCFPGVSFIVMPRDPYAWCESIKRRRKPGKPAKPMEETALRWVRSAAWHIHNIKTLERVTYFTYEDLCDRTPDVLERLRQFMPELGEMRPEGEFEVHSALGKRRNPITNTNESALGRLDSTEIGAISRTLNAYPDITAYFGYKVLG